MTTLFATAYLVIPLACWLFSAFVLKRRLHWWKLFMIAWMVGYADLLLLVGAQVVSDALTRRDIDATVVFGDGNGSDAGLALAPVLGIPVTLVWTAINFMAFSVIEWSYRTDFRSFLFGGGLRERNVEQESPEIVSSDNGQLKLGAARSESTSEPPDRFTPQSQDD